MQQNDNVRHGLRAAACTLALLACLTGGCEQAVERTLAQDTGATDGTSHGDIIVSLDVSLDGTAIIDKDAAVPPTDTAPADLTQADTKTTGDTSSPVDTTPPGDTSPPVDTSLPTDTPLVDRLAVEDLTVAEGVAAGVQVWRVWGRGSLRVAPVFTAPLANCGTLVGYSASTNGHSVRVAELDANDALVQVFSLDAGLECRGLAAEPDGHFAVLAWDPAAERIWVKRYDTDGNQVWSTELVNPTNHPNDFTIGDSRLTYGDGRYGAYYHTHSDTGHEGDTLKWVTVGGAETTGWAWGCSHSMSALLSFHPALAKFMPACVTDCYPGTTGDFVTESRGGIVLNHAARVMDVAGGCNGSVGGELGGAAPSPSGWILAFNAHQAPAALGQSSYDGSMNQDIGLAIVGGAYATQDITWLTNTASIDEADAAIAAWLPKGDTSEQYLVGWSESGSQHQLARIGGAGQLLEGPVDVAPSVSWGRRDDPFRQHTNGDVVWSWFDSPGSTTLHFARVRSGSSASCASF